MTSDIAPPVSNNAANAAPVPEAPAPAGPRRLTADEQQPTPEEQEQYNTFVSTAFMMIYDKKFLPQALKMLEGGGDPIEGLAIASSKIVHRVMKVAQEGGEKLGGDVLFHGAKEIFEDLAELATREGIKDFSGDPDAMEGAFFRALDHFRVLLQESGDLNQEAAQQDLAMLQQMDEEGELENVFLGLAAKDDERAASAAPAAGPGMDEEMPPQQEAPPRGGGLMPKGAR